MTGKLKCFVLLEPSEFEIALARPVGQSNVGWAGHTLDWRAPRGYLAWVGPERDGQDREQWTHTGQLHASELCTWSDPISSPEEKD